MDEHVIPEELHPRVLIKAIQENLGITKKEISERTGISYGTLNRYTRNTAPIGRPRRTSIERLKKLYRYSLGKFGRATESGQPGADYKMSLLKETPAFAELNRAAGFGAASLDHVDLLGLGRGPFVKFLRRLAYYAAEDLEQFKASGYRDRQRIHESRELAGDLYLALINDLCDESFSPRPAKEPQ